MDKKSALKKEQEKKSQQLTLLQQQILQAIYINSFFKYQQRLTYQKKIKKMKHLMYLQKRRHLKKQHLLHMQYECCAIVKEAKPKAELLMLHGFFAKQDLMELPTESSYMCYK